MSKLAETYIHFNFNLSSEDQSLLEEYLYFQAKKISFAKFKAETSINVEIRSGSTKIAVTISGFLVAFNLVAQYGSFRSGIDHLIEDSKKSLNLFPNN